MSESCFSSIVHKDFHEAMMAKKDAEIEALRAEVSTPVLVATNRLADALADARAEIAKLRAEREELKKHIAKLEGALQNLQFAESRYRYQHDALGDGHIKTGMAWDSMKKRGDEARAALTEKGE